MKKKYIFSTLFGLACLVAAFYNVEWSEIWEAFRTVNYAYIPLFVLCHVLAVLLRSRRWGLILQPIKKIGFYNLISAVSIGFMANFIFPARIGELVRAYLIGRKERISKTSSFATVVVERLFDGFTILSVLALVPLFLEVPPGKEELMAGIWKASGVAFAVYFLVLAALFFFRHRRETFMRLADLVVGRLPEKISSRLTAFIHSFGDGLGILGNLGHILYVMAWSVMLWGVMGVGNWIMFKAFDIQLPIYAGFFLLVVQAFGAMFPSPGFVGTYQVAHVLGLSLFGVSREVSLSLAILIHGIIYLHYVLFGVAFLWAENLGLKDIRQKEGEE